MGSCRFEGYVMLSFNLLNLKKNALSFSDLSAKFEEIGIDIFNLPVLQPAMITYVTS